MILPPAAFVAPEPLAARIASITHGGPMRAYELAHASVVTGLASDVDPRWLAANCAIETPTLRPGVPGGVCTVGRACRTIAGSVAAAGRLYARIAALHGRRNAHLWYACGSSRCGGVWPRCAKYKAAMWRRWRREV